MVRSQTHGACVVYGWEDRHEAVEPSCIETMRAMQRACPAGIVDNRKVFVGIDRPVTSGRTQPYYRVLCRDSYSRCCPQDTLTPLDPSEASQHTGRWCDSLFFTAVDSQHGFLQPNKDLAARYAEDCGVQGCNCRGMKHAA